jgi:hypothetical protein
MLFLFMSAECVCNREATQTNDYNLARRRSEMGRVQLAATTVSDAGRQATRENAVISLEEKLCLKVSYLS